MINWYSILSSGLWIGGAALLLAALGWRFYIASLQSSGNVGVSQVFDLAMALIALGLAFQRHTPPWQSGLWLALALLFIGDGWIVRMQRQDGVGDIASLLRAQLGRARVAALALILLGVLMASLYALITRPWMQPDEPRHYEVIMHNARLGKFGSDYDDLNLDWEREIIANMEAESFWWYGYSRTGWDPNHLPESFDKIWTERNAWAFYQLPLYYDIAGLFFYAWSDSLSPAQMALLLRFFSIFWLALSLGGVYAIGRELFPRHPQVALGALAFAALWPAHLAANAAVNNGPMAEALVIWTTFLAVRLLRRGPSLRRLTWFFLLIILTLYTKRTGFSVLALLLAIPLWGAGQMRRQAAGQARRIGAAMLAGGLIALPFLFYLAKVTGRYWLPDAVSPARLWSLLRTAPWLKFMLALYRTFWGWFGWLRVPLPGVIYWVGAPLTLVFLLLMALGYLQIFGRRDTPVSHRDSAPGPGASRLAGWQRSALLLLLLALIMQVGLTFGKDILYQDWKTGSVPQIRYLFPLLPAMLLPTFYGWRKIAPTSWQSWTLPTLISALVLFNLYILAFILYPFYWL